MLAVLIVAAGLTVAAKPQAAEAFPWQAKLCSSFAGCNAQGRGNAGYQNVYTNSYWNMYGGHNCTNYVAFRLQQNGIAQFTTPGNGNATNWGGQAAARGIAVDRSNPQVGDVAWFTEAQIGFSGGHVAYIESVNLAAGTFIVSEDNYGGDFDWRQYNIGDVSGFIHVGAKPAPPVPTGSSNGGKAITSPNVGRCIDVNGGGTANGTKVQLYDCNSSPAQQWVYQNGALHVFGNYPKCMDITGGVFALGTAVQTWDCNGSPAQQWNINGDGTITAQGWCLDADAGGYSANGTKLQIWQCLGGVNQQWAGFRAVNTGSPSISGATRVGATLSTSAGSWSTSGLALTYQWYCNGVPIPGATHPTFALGTGAVGRRYSAVVTASADGLLATRVSTAETVAVSLGTLRTAVPTITGAVQVGRTLTATPGNWTTGTAFAFQWSRNGKAIIGARSGVYKLVAADLGARIAVRVGGSRSGFAPGSRGSAPTARVAAAPRTLAAATPVVAGLPVVGHNLKAKIGTWTPGTTVTYQWFRGTTAISGATGSAYTATAADVGAQLRVRVTGTHTGYSTVAKTSAPTAIVRAR